MTVGDVVQLKGGGPVMTVSEVDGYQADPRMHVHCQWFDGYELLSGRFYLPALQVMVQGVDGRWTPKKDRPAPTSVPGPGREYTP